VESPSGTQPKGNGGPKRPCRKHCQGSAYQADEDLVFSHPLSGKPLDASRISRSFMRPALKQAGIEKPSAFPRPAPYGPDPRGGCWEPADLRSAQGRALTGGHYRALHLRSASPLPRRRGARRGTDVWFGLSALKLGGQQRRSRPSRRSLRVTGRTRRPPERLPDRTTSSKSLRCTPICFAPLKRCRRIPLLPA
jgi:hypothetical protein